MDLTKDAWSPLNPRSRVGEKVFVDNEERTLVSLIKNVDEKLVAVWEASRTRAQGVCVLSVWDDWKKGNTKGSREQL